MAKYQYSYVDLEYVMNNPDEYIIPECQEACRLFWDKNIETFMVSNDDDDFLYVFVTGLSDENLEIMKKQIESNPDNYFFSDYRNCYGIRVPGTTKEDSEKLTSLTSVFKIQDTFRYQTTEDFLESYKTTGGGYEMDPETFAMIRQPNPELANATLEEALEKENKKDLYVAEEQRVYTSKIYLEWHQRYKKSKEIDNMIQKDEKKEEISGKRMD